MEGRQEPDCAYGREEAEEEGQGGRARRTHQWTRCGGPMAHLLRWPAAAMARMRRGSEAFLLVLVCAVQQVRTLKVEEPTDSFFNFFDPPNVPEEEDEMDEEEVDQLHETLETDYEVDGHARF